MGKNSSRGVDYYLRIKKEYQDDLTNIRPWTDLKLGFDEEHVWVKGFNHQQINSLEVKSMPYKTVYYGKNGELFFKNSLLPDRIIPSLIWTSIARALPVELPHLNHNYFDIERKISTKLIPSEKEAKAVAILTKIDTLRAYITSAPDVRLKPLKWVIVNGDSVLIMGLPMLPIKGETYWLHENMLIPTGYDFDPTIIKTDLNELLNPSQRLVIVWNQDSSYFDFEATDWQQLSINSFRLSI